MNPNKDVILSLGAFSVIDDSVVIKENFEAVLLQYKFLEDNGLSNEFIIESKMTKMPEAEALEAFINFLGNAILVGHHINFDIEMLNQMLSRLKLGKLKNEAYDIEAMFNKLSETNDKKYAMEEMSKFLNISISERNSVADDAYSIAILFLKLKSKLGIK